MLKAIIELSKYILVINLFLYTVTGYIALRWDDRERRGFLFVLQYSMIFINHMTGSLVLLSSRQDFTYLFFPMFQMLAVFAYLVLMRAIYPKSNRMILNHIVLLLSVGFVILTRLSLTRSMRQFMIVAASLLIGLIVPSLMKQFQLIKRCAFIFAAAGIVVLGAVLIRGSLVNGSRLSFSVFGLRFQPSEFIKIIYVIFIACLLARAKRFSYILLSAALAAAHVLILAASKDLGSALIYFITYVVMLFVATRKVRYMAAGLVGAAAASYVSYFLFAHVRVRVEAWLDPWNDINATGYQIAQSLFGIGTGGWFGMGIDAGSPASIPYVEQDFIFSAVCEEFGVLFGICLIAICVNLFLEIVRVSHSCLEPFVKYAVYGLGVVYISQLFLTIGGNTKFIPLTGVTLPLISYGGSSVLASIMMFSVVQGFYINNDLLLAYEGTNAKEDEDAFVPYIPKFHMNAAAGVFAALFVGICIYLGHFVYFDSTKVINNSFNAKRQEILASKTIRGDILSADGQVLATTLADGDERYYPYSKLFAHAIGYASNGRMGVEQSANIYLVSSNVSLNSKLSDDLADTKHMGNTVVTTLDARLQKLSYDALGLYEGAVIIMEPKTGKILAMVSKPDFDPNTIDVIWEELLADEESSVLVNRTTQGLYPPGSTFKIFTALAYIREHPADYEQYEFDCNSQFKWGDSVINCFHGTRHGTVDFTRSFAKSCNASFADIGLLLNRTQFKEMLDTFYFNQKLPVNFLSNQSSISEQLETNDNDMIQTVIGQGQTQMTPLHLAMVTAMVANGGNMMQPYLIDHVENADKGIVDSFVPHSLGQLISAEEAENLKRLMRAVVMDGTGSRLMSEKYNAAGKTGSAEYNSKSDSHAWFTGFTYDTDRPLQITVIMEGAGSGGEYAVPVARRILDGYYAEYE
ncbi:hypothetical protein C809_02778 [Lachnospiraceae bacterium MD335]|nr:hypothetical protein C809_02778 [Lachnospiraceae bacterium MD335]